MTDAARDASLGKSITAWAKLVRIFCLDVALKDNNAASIGDTLREFRNKTRNNAKRTGAYGEFYTKLEEDPLVDEELLRALPKPDNFEHWKANEPSKSFCEALEDLILLTRPTTDTIFEGTERKKLQEELAKNLRENFTTINNEELDEEVSSKITKESTEFLAEINAALSTADTGGAEPEPEPAVLDDRPPPLVDTVNDSARPESSDTDDSQAGVQIGEDEDNGGVRQGASKDKGDAAEEADEDVRKKAGAKERAGAGKKPGAKERADDDKEPDPPGVEISASDSDSDSDSEPESEPEIPPPKKTSGDGPSWDLDMRVIKPPDHQHFDYWTFESLQAVLAQEPEEPLLPKLCQEPFYNNEKSFSRLLDLRDEMENKGLPHAFDYKRIMAMILRALAVESAQLRTFSDTEPAPTRYIKILIEMDEGEVLWFQLQLTAKQQYRYGLMSGKYAQLVDNFMTEWSRQNKYKWERYDNIGVGGPTERLTLDDRYFEQYFTNIAELAETPERKAKPGEDEESDKNEESDEEDDDGDATKAGKVPTRGDRAPDWRASSW